MQANDDDHYGFTDETSDGRDEYGPRMPEKPPEDDALGHWVWEEYGWFYVLNSLGVVVAAEEERLIEEMARQHYAELAARRNGPAGETTS